MTEEVRELVAFELDLAILSYFLASQMEGRENPPKPTGAVASLSFEPVFSFSLDFYNRDGSLAIYHSLDNSWNF